MAESEAAALLRVGAIYPRRIGLRDSAGRLIFAGVKRGALSLYCDDEPIYHFDLDGRWQRAYIDGNHYRKALSQSVDRIARSPVQEGIALRRSSASRTEIDALDDSIRAAVLDVCVGLSQGRFAIVSPPDPALALGVEDLRDLLDRVATWDPAAWFARKEQYVRIYGTRLSFIPPDAQNAIVLQPFNGDGSPRNADEFAAHCRDVSKFLRRRVIQASTAFLDDVSSLRRPVAEILTNLDAIATVFPVRDDPRPIMPRDLPTDRASLSGIDLSFEFWHDGGALPDLEGWRAIASHRVRRVTASFRNEGVGDDSTASIVDAKAAGIAVSVVLPHGPGDRERPMALADLVDAMPLGRGDSVYLMEVQGEDAPSQVEVQRQRESLKSRLAPTRERGAKIADYNPAKQWS